MLPDDRLVVPELVRIIVVIEEPGIRHQPTPVLLLPLASSTAMYREICIAPYRSEHGYPVRAQQTHQSIGSLSNRARSARSGSLATRRRTCVAASARNRTRHLTRWRVVRTRWWTLRGTYSSRVDLRDAFTDLGKRIDPGEQRQPRPTSNESAGRRKNGVLIRRLRSSPGTRRGRRRTSWWSITSWPRGRC